MLARTRWPAADASRVRPHPEEIHLPRLSRRAVLVLALVLGLGLWLLPALVLGEPEPWDSDGPAYPAALLGSGLVLGFLGPGQPGAAVAGVFGGQLLVLLGRVVASPGTSELWLIGAMILAVYTLVVTGVGALMGSAARGWLGFGAPPGG